MQPKTNHKKIRVQVLSAVREAIDAEALWLDDSIEPEELIRIDPLDASELEEVAEHPELGDYHLQSLSKGLPEKVWQVVWQAARQELGARHGGESAADFVRRVRGSS